MKTIANIMIINSQNVKPENLVISSHHNISFQRKLSLRQDELSKVLLDDPKYLTCVQLVYTHVNDGTWPSI